MRTANEAQVLLAWLHSDPRKDEGETINEIAERYGESPQRVRELITETTEGT